MLGVALVGVEGLGEGDGGATATGFVGGFHLRDLLYDGVVGLRAAERTAPASGAAGHFDGDREFEVFQFLLLRPSLRPLTHIRLTPKRTLPTLMPRTLYLRQRKTATINFPGS